MGIGACTAIISVVSKLLLEPLPHPQPDRLVQLMSVSNLGDQSVASIPKYVIWRNRTSAFRKIAAYDVGDAGVNLTQGSARIAGDLACVDLLFPAGRTSGDWPNLSLQEDTAGGPRLAVISMHSGVVLRR
jgi:putative ABC transport system permease protein